MLRPELEWFTKRKFCRPCSWRVPALLGAETAQLLKMPGVAGEIAAGVERAYRAGADPVCATDTAGGYCG